MMRTAFNLVMRVISSLLGVLLVLMGGVWVLQGLGLAFLSSFMAHQVQWSVYGVLLALVGVAQIVWSNTRQTGTGDPGAAGTFT